MSRKVKPHKKLRLKTNGNMNFCTVQTSRHKLRVTGRMGHPTSVDDPVLVGWVTVQSIICGIKIRVELSELCPSSTCRQCLSRLPHTAPDYRRGTEM